MSYLEELLPEFRKGAKIRQTNWSEKEYIRFNGKYIVNEDGEEFLDNDLFFSSVLEDSWEFYHAPEPDWQYIIDHKCLCEFWDDEEYSIVGCLIKIHEKIDGMNGLHDYYKFMEENGRSWSHCRPVRRDEVTFYEDKKDE